jgi:hypothetical protein
MSAPLRSAGPPEYTGSSWTYLSLTTDGETTAALASAGTWYSESYSRTTVTVSPAGVTSRTSPTGMPRILTSDPG